MTKFRYFTVAAMLLFALIAIASASSSTPISRGAAIFNGKEPIKGSIPGHDSTLPPQMARCVNCHAAAKPSRTNERFAPILNRDWLLQSRARHGGPAYAYTKDGFCQTLRTGIDPEYVILNRAMPRFDANPEQCAALWAYLTQPASQASSQESTHEKK